MYAGHVAIGLALKAREPRLPVVPLALACFGPDWVETLLMLGGVQSGFALYTHSIPAVVAGATVAAALYAAFRRPGALLIFVGWLLHWPADLLTGHKPLFASTPLIGLDLYSLPAVDFALESVVIVICCSIYARRYAVRAESRRTIVLLAAALIALQGAVDVALSMTRNSEWTPSLALSAWQAQLSCPASVPVCQSSAYILQPTARSSTASDVWRRTAPGV
jgi:hypothetical protein